MSIIFPGFFPWFSSVIRQQLHVFPIKGAIEKMRRLARWRHSEESGGEKSAMDGKKYNEFYREAFYIIFVVGL